MPAYCGSPETLGGVEMCIAEQSGICNAGGPPHNHSWQSVFEGTVPKAKGRPAVIQLRGLRDDGQAFHQTAVLTENRDHLITVLRQKLDQELKCCTCLGDGH
jgi:hypothetical protein